MTVVPHAGSRRMVLHRETARPARTGVMSPSAFAIGAVAVLSIGLLMLLALNTALAKGSFRAFELREQLLRTEIEAASSPVALAQRAQEMGLVPATAPVFIRLSDGTILGEPYEAGLAIDPVTGAPVTGEGLPAAVPGAAAVDPNTVGEPQATAPSTPAEQAPVAESDPTPGVATAPGTDAEQPLGLTDR
jgi:hypothetical protein